MTLQKKTLLHMVRRAHSSCAPNTIQRTVELGQRLGEAGQQAGKSIKRTVELGQLLGRLGSKQERL
jgi:hypothetical protein